MWAPEPTGADEILSTSVEEWIADVEFESTADVPIPDRLVDQVIGQEAGSVVIKKAAEQRRHMLMIGDPGTGKSMLARSMTDLLPKDALEDVLVYPNEDDENVPRVRTVPAGRAERIVKVQKEAIRQQRENPSECSSSAFAAIRFCCSLQPFNQVTCSRSCSVVFCWCLVCMFIRSRLGATRRQPYPEGAREGTTSASSAASSTQPLLFPGRCWVMCVTIRSNRGEWKHRLMIELSRAPITAHTRVFSTLTRSTCFASANNKRSLRPCKTRLSRYRRSERFLWCPHQNRARTL